MSCLGQADLRLLIDEEKLIREMIQKLTDQLNRLKVEELALRSKSRDEKISDATCTADGSSLSVPDLVVDMEGVNSESDHQNVNSAELNLNVNLSNKTTHDFAMVEEDESDDEVSGKGDLAYFLTDGGY